MAREDWRCVFLAERDGTPKRVGNYDTLDMSIYADCFVVIGMAAYSIAAENSDAYVFAKKLYKSIKDRIDRNEFNTLPYPLDGACRAHGIPMILTNVAKELHEAALVHDKTSCPGTSLRYGQDRNRCGDSLHGQKPHHAQPASDL